MTATSAPTAAAAANKAPARPYVAYGIFLLCATAYLLPFMRFMLQGTDEGTLLYGAVRVVHGQVFARDFFEVIGPGTFYCLAGFFKLFGITFLATRIYLFLASLGTGVLIYFLSRRISSRYQALPAILVAGASFGMLWPTISHHADSNFFALMAIACMVLWNDRRNPSLLLAAGVLTAIATCMHQPKGILLLFAFLTWLAILRWRRSASRSSLAILLAAYSIAIAMVLLYFWSHNALRDLIDATYTWPSQNYGTVNAVPYAQGILRYYWDHWVILKSGFYWTIPLAAILLTPLLFIAALPALLPVLGLARRRNIFNPTVLLYWLSGSALWLAEFHRRDIFHLAMGSPVLILLCIHLIAESRSKLAANALQLLAISGVCLAGFNLCLVLTAHPTPTRVGSIAMLQPDPVLTYLDSNVAPGQEIFAYPYCPMYYFLSSTANPTRYSILMYGYNTPSQFEEVVRTLEARRTKYVVWNTGFAKGGIRLFSPSAQWPGEGQLIVEPYLASHYTAVWSDGVTQIMERNSGPPPK